MNDAIESRTRNYLSLYADMEQELKWVALWRVRLDRTYRRADLARELSARAVELSRMRPDQDGLWVAVFTESTRQSLIAIDHDGVVAASTADLTSNAAFVAEYHGEGYLRKGGQSVFTLMVLPLIGLATYARADTEIEIKVPYRDLEFLINAKGFAAFFDVSWTAFLAEMGDKEATLRILPIEATKTASFFTLSELAEETGLHRPQDADARVLYSFELLDRAFMDTLPGSVRPSVEPHTNPTTLGRNRSDRWLSWQRGWRGALLCAVVQVTADTKFIVRNAALARQIAAEFATLLERRTSELTWLWACRDLLTKSFSTYAGPQGVVTLFDLVMQQLEARESGRWFGALLDEIERSRGDESKRFLDAAFLSKNYANHERIARIRASYNESFTSALRHAYFPERQEIWLDKVPARHIAKGDVVADRYADYSTGKKVKTLVESRRLDLKNAIEKEANQLLDDVVKARTTRDFSNEEFTNEAITRAAKAINLSDDDFETATQLTSVRVTDVKLRSDLGINRYAVTFNFVKRLEDETVWRDVEGTTQTVSELDFEFMLWAWAFGRSGERIETAGLIIVGIGLIAVAWEVGVIAVLVEAAGGTAVVLTSIALSNILYLVFAKHYTLEGFVMATIDGYLFALTFRFGGIAGRALALRIGTQTMRPIVGGWAVERLVTGVVGGGLGGGVVTFAHGLAGVLLHQSQFPTLGDFVKGMTMGAVFGLFGEFVLGPALQTAFRVGGKTVLNTTVDAIKMIRESGTSPARYAAEVTEALGAIRQRLSTFLEEASVREIIAQLRERMAALGEGLGSLPGAIGAATRRRLQFAAYRRIFELAETGLGRTESDGLGRLLAVTESGAAQMTEEQLLTFLNRLAGDRQHTLDVLHALGRLSDERATAVIARQQLDAMTGSSNLLRHLRGGDADRVWEVWSGSAFGLRTPELESFLGRISRQADQQQVFGLEVLRRPDQLVTPEGVAIGIEKAGLSNETLPGLDRLYGAVDLAAADGIMRAVPTGNARGYLAFLGRLHPVNVRQLANEGFVGPLAHAPRVVAFASRGNNVGVLRGLTSVGNVRGSVAEIVQGLEEFFTRESALSSAEQDEAVGLLRALIEASRGKRHRFPDLQTLRAAAAAAREAGLAEGLNVGLERLTRLIADNVDPSVARSMLDARGHTVTDVTIPGPGALGPDVQLQTPAGVVGRESLAVTPQTVPIDAATARARVRSTLVSNIDGKVNLYARRTYDHSRYASREFDVQVRRASDGNTFDSILDEALFRDVMTRLRSVNPSARIDRVRFYNSSGTLVFEWTP